MKKYRIKTWEKLLEVSKVDRDGDLTSLGEECCFNRGMKYLCGRELSVWDGWETLIDNWKIIPWMVEEVPQEMDNNLPTNFMEFVGVVLVNNSPFPDPTYKFEGDSGMDIKANLLLDPEGFGKFELSEDRSKIKLYPNSRVMIHTGIHMEMPLGIESQVRSRSGLSFKDGLQVTGGLGTVDAPYRGDVGIVINNVSDEIKVVEHGDRVAQLVFCKVLTAQWNKRNSLDRKSVV